MLQKCIPVRASSTAKRNPEMATLVWYMSFHVTCPCSSHSWSIQCALGFSWLNNFHQRPFGRLRLVSVHSSWVPQPPHVGSWFLCLGQRPPVCLISMSGAAPLFPLPGHLLPAGRSCALGWVWIPQRPMWASGFCVCLFLCLGQRPFPLCLAPSCLLGAYAPLAGCMGARGCKAACVSVALLQPPPLHIPTPMWHFPVISSMFG